MQRRARLWRALIVCCLAAFVVAIAVAQQALRRSLERQLADLNVRYPAAMAESARVKQLKQEAAEADAFGALYTYLEHPWPTTQLLAAVAGALPDTATISEIKLESSQIQNSGSAPTPPPTTTPPATTTEAAKRDLEKLRAAQDNIAYTLHVSGVTSDTKQLHAFVRQLAPSPLFKSAKLESLESLKSENRLAESRFELRLFLRAGFGQPGGPIEPQVEPAAEPDIVAEFTRSQAPPGNALPGGSASEKFRESSLVIPRVSPRQSLGSLQSQAPPASELGDAWHRKSAPTYEFISTLGEARP